jgi:hypothetical protein
MTSNAPLEDCMISSSRQESNDKFRFRPSAFSSPVFRFDFHLVTLAPRCKMSCSNEPTVAAPGEDEPAKLMPRSSTIQTCPAQKVQAADQLRPKSSLFFPFVWRVEYTCMRVGKAKLDSKICVRCKTNKGVLAIRHMSYCSFVPFSFPPSSLCAIPSLQPLVQLSLTLDLSLFCLQRLPPSLPPLQIL